MKLLQLEAEGDPKEKYPGNTTPEYGLSTTEGRGITLGIVKCLCAWVDPDDSHPMCFLALEIFVYFLSDAEECLLGYRGSATPAVVPKISHTTSEASCSTSALAFFLSVCLVCV